MSGILGLESLTKGNTLRQGDLTLLKYRLFDADGDKLDISGKPATVRLMKNNFTFIAYEKEGLIVAPDDTISFSVNKVLPAGLYHLEIIVDDKYIFPSRSVEGEFNVDKSTLGADINIVEATGVEAVARKATGMMKQDEEFIDDMIANVISDTNVGNIEEYYNQFNEATTEFESLKTQAINADTLSKSVQEQFNQVVIDGDSSVESAQARVDASGQANATLKARLDKEHNEVTTQLAENTTDLLERGVNVKNFGAVGDGIADDTIAIQKAIDYTSSRLFTNRPNGGMLVGAIPTIIFPRGHYLVSDEIVYNAYSKILSHDGAIVEQTTVGKNIFTCDNAFNINVVGMNFVKGKHAFQIANANANQALFNFVNCSFQLQESYSVMTESNHATYTHLSANLTFDKCHFRNPNKVLHNVCDSAIMNDCWVQLSGDNFTPDSAAFMQAKGRLFLNNLFTVPANIGVVPNARWIDAYEDVISYKCRFGGEDGGIPIVYYLGDRAWETSLNRLPVSIVFRDSWLYCGTDSNPNKGVIHTVNSIPGYINVQGCELVGPIINNSGNIDYSTYFIDRNQADFIRYRFDIDENIIGVGGGTNSLPDEFKYYTRMKFRPSTDIPNGIELGNNSSFSLVDGDILGGLSFSGVDQSAGASGTRAKLYAQVKGTAGQTDLVFEVATNSGKPREVLRITHDAKLLLNGVEVS